MTIEQLENIKYFELKKELFGHPIGSQVVINKGDSPCLLIEGIRVPIEYASNYEWLEPVTVEQYKILFENNCIKYFMEEKGLTPEKAKKVFKSMFDK